jgi:hypothetical protein
METERYRPWCSMTPLIWSIMPIGVAAGFVWLVHRASPSILRPGNWGCFGGFLYGPALLFVGFLIAVITIPMGIYSVLSGVDAIRDPEARGKALIAVAIALGILDIVAGSGYLFWTFSKVF